MNILTRGLRRVGDLFRVHNLEGETVNLEHLDPTQLKQAYREVPFVAPIVNVAASFIFAGGIEVRSEDEEAAEACTDFFRANDGDLQRAAVEACLYGYTWLLPHWDDGRPRLRVYSPGAVALIPHPDRPWVTQQAVITSTQGPKRTVQTITADRYEITVNGRVAERGRNPLGLIPVIPVHLNRFSDDLYGTGEISDVLYLSLREYALLRAKGIKIEKRQSSLLAISGLKGFEALKSKIEKLAAGDAIPGIYLPDPKGSVKFVESLRGPEGIIELLKMLYHHIIGQSETPEYLLGVGMPSAQASTAEQRAVIERKTARLRSSWSAALQQLNHVVLRLHEVHQVRRYETMETDIEFGPLFDKDAAAAAAALQKKSVALVGLQSVGAISTETMRENLEEVVDDPEREAERVKKERESGAAFPYPPEPEPAEPGEEEEEPGE